MNLATVQRKVRKLAIGRSWWGAQPNDVLMRHLALLASEVGEAVHVVQGADERGQPFDRQALAEELADCVIRAADIADTLGLDLDAAVDEKFRKLIYFERPSGAGEETDGTRGTQGAAT